MKLIGYIDGVEVLFDFHPPNQFKAEIPKQLDGSYIVELYALDLAGNKSSLYSSIFIRIDYNNLKMEVLPSNYNFINGEEVAFRRLESQYTLKELDKVDFNIAPLNFAFRELVN